MRPLLLFFIAIFFSTQISYGQSKWALEWSECYMDNCDYFKNNNRIEFGHITVPEDYEYPQQKRIKIAFAVIKAADSIKKKDAIIYFQGGWGSPSLKPNLQIFAERFPIKNRDLILFDYRGSGFSEPQLCDWIGQETWGNLSLDLSDTEFNKRQVNRLNQCLDSLDSKNIDYNKYGSNIKAKDALALAEALGYESYNLYGISYGTRSIQNIFRELDSSSINIRSAVLDSNVAIGNTHHVMSIPYAEVLNKIFADCENNKDCATAYPNLKERFFNFLDSLNKHPFIIPYKEQEFVFNKEEINAVLHQIIYNSSTFKDIPIFIENLLNREAKAFSGLLSTFEKRVEENFNGLGLINFVYDWGLQQEKTKLRLAEAQAKFNNYSMTDGYLSFYLSDIRIAKDSLENIPVTSDVPSLVIAGEYDPTTPPEWSLMVAEGLSNHYYYELEKVGHGATFDKCGVEILKSFLDDPLTEPTVVCLEQNKNKEIPFRTDYYKNKRISKFTSDLIINPKKTSILIVGLILVISIIVIISSIIKMFKKNKKPSKLIFFTFLGILVFIVLLAYFINLSSAASPILILFGLVASSKYIFYLVPLIWILGLIIVFKTIKSRSFNVINLALILGIGLFMILTLSYGLFPNLS